MATYKTPGVYVEEISTLPPSVAEVSTAIPAFIGYTEKGPKIQPTRISSMVEYRHLFGGAHPSAFTVEFEQDPDVEFKPGDPTTDVKVVKKITRDESGVTPKFLMYYCLSMYFNNGGGPCYIVSVGGYASTPAIADFAAGQAEVAKEDEPTLILLTDAVNLAPADYYSLCQQALAQCGKLKDRFAIFDVLEGDAKGAAFRNGIGTSDLKYGAAYHPYLQTTLNYAYDEDGVSASGLSVEPTAKVWSLDTDQNGVTVTYTGSGTSPNVKINKTAGASEFSVSDNLLTIRNVGDNGMPVAELLAAWTTWKQNNDPVGFDIIQAGDGSAPVKSSSQNLPLSAPAAATPAATLASLKNDNTQRYNQIKTALTTQRVVLPPSSAMAGIYAKVDRERGVWKAPANVSLASVIGPTVKITHDDQEGLNVDPTAGKSINAIRSFVGKGTMVWGARTLAGNDNEWRYINVRRLFNMIEESTQKATAFAVFEANDATTWLKVKGMIESFLYGLWEQGALAGPKPDSAYFVNVGLGKTMTTQDVLEGRMIVEIGVAAVRPAEFIILRFTHKLQEA